MASREKTVVLSIASAVGLWVVWSVFSSMFLKPIADLETQKEAGAVADKRYRQDLKDLKFQLSRVLEKLGPRQKGA